MNLNVGLAAKSNVLKGHEPSLQTKLVSYGDCNVVGTCTRMSERGLLLQRKPQTCSKLYNFPSLHCFIAIPSHGQDALSSCPNVLPQLPDISPTFKSLHFHASSMSNSYCTVCRPCKMWMLILWKSWKRRGPDTKQFPALKEYWAHRQAWQTAFGRNRYYICVESFQKNQWNESICSASVD